MSKSNKYVKKLYEFLIVLQENLTLKQQRMEEISMEDIQKKWNELTAIKEIDLSWIADKDTQDTIRAEIEAHNTLVVSGMTSIHEDITGVKSEVIGVRSDLSQTNEMLNKVISLMKIQYQIYEGLEMGKDTAISEVSYILDDANDIVYINGISDENDGKVAIYEQYNIDGKIYNTKIASGFNMKNKATLTSVTVGDKVDWSEYTSAKELFYGCTALTDINLGKGFYDNTPNITSMEYMFYGCNLTAELINNILDTEKFNSSNVTTMAYLFANCANLVEISLLLNISRLTTASNMFSGCNNLTNVSINSIIDEGCDPAINCSSIFSNCYKLTNFNISDEFMLHMNNINNFANECTILPTLELTIDISKFAKLYSYIDINNLSRHYNKNGGVKNIILNITGYASNTIRLQYLSAYNNNLTSVKLTNENPDNMFDFTNWLESNDSYGVPNLKSVEIIGFNNFIDDSVIFTNITNIEIVKLHGFKNTTNPHALVSPYKSTIKSILLEGFDNAERIPYLYGATNLVDIEFKNFASNHKLINVANAGQSFRGCTSLVSVKGLNNIINEYNSFTDLGLLFYQCTSLETIDLTGCTINSPGINSLFFGCTALTNIIGISNVIADNIKSAASVFMNCPLLTSLNISGFNLSAATTAKNMFKGSTALTEILVDRNKWIPDTCDATDMFADCGTSEVTYIDAA